MRSFGHLLRKLRGQTSLRELATRVELSYSYLANLEAGRKIADADRAEEILKRGFELDAPGAERLILGVQLYDLGLRDNAVRQLVVDVIRKDVPAWVPKQLRDLYRSYAE